MEYNQLPKGFFKKNPLDQLSAANIAYFSITAGFDEDLENEVFDLARKKMDAQRLDKINREREEIPHLETGEDFVRFMRSDYDIVNRHMLCKRALTMQQIVIPPMLHRFCTSMQDMFIETAVYILAHAEQSYVEQLKTLYVYLFTKYDLPGVWDPKTRGYPSSGCCGIPAPTEEFPEGKPGPRALLGHLYPVQ